MLTMGEAGQLLAATALVDGRAVTDAGIKMWHRLLSDLSFPECVKAIDTFHREDDRFLKPVHIRRIVEQGRHEAQKEPGRSRREFHEWCIARDLNPTAIEQGDQYEVGKARALAKDDPDAPLELQ